MKIELLKSAKGNEQEQNKPAILSACDSRLLRNCLEKRPKLKSSSNY